ncbi:protein VAC14 homolog [Capsicum annuum]|uniref:protein VAC14 homolog n=1 Tax=Capsicum annuum TaxID=4072 RepID=UPI001FB071A7|nr:protein VAC14 homolog [Capsicum annuum]
MVQALNLILLTASELSDLRDLLKQSLINADGKNLFLFLYASWCHSPMAIISLCLLAQAYPHASSVIHLLVEEDINVKFLVQLDKLIHLLETPTFAYLRLQVFWVCPFIELLNLEMWFPFYFVKVDNFINIGDSSCMQKIYQK